MVCTSVMYWPLPLACKRPRFTIRPFEFFFDYRHLHAKAPGGIADDRGFADTAAINRILAAAMTIF